MSDRRHKTLRVFPDSGHHVVFFPLHAERTLGLEALSGLQELRTSQRETLEGRAQRDDWRSPVGQPWLLGRVGYRTYSDGDASTEVLGLWVAVETATGGRDRGYVRLREEDPQENLTAEAERLKAAEEAERLRLSSNAGGYIARKPSELGDRTRVEATKAFDLPDGIAPLILDLVWVKEAGAPVPVDLIVDFGNSRTVVLGLERSVTDVGFASICKPILFPPPGHDLEELNFDNRDFDSAIPDSWFTLADTVFQARSPRAANIAVPREPGGLLSRLLGQRGPARTETRPVWLTPHMFREISPAVLGPAARKSLSRLDVEGGGLSFLSSPKRYVWDNAPMGVGRGRTYWTMNQQPWRAPGRESASLVPLAGEFSRFMPNAGAEWTLDSWPYLTGGSFDAVPDHPRADALVWVALSIIEQAWRQIQSESWRKGNQPFLRRELGDVLLTYPSGWTEEEIDIYRSKWRRARDIFALSRLPAAAERAKDGELPKVEIELDEAVASQLAIIYSEIRHMSNVGENWIGLYGRDRGGEDTVRVMTIDIGGGTTDTSIVEYRDAQPGVGVDLMATLLSKDSTTVAGDRLVKDIAERVLLPTIGARFARSAVKKDLFERLFFTRAKRAGEQAAWSVIARTVIIPIVQQWLRMLGQSDRPEDFAALTPRTAGAAEDQLGRLNQLAEAAGLGPLLDMDEPVPADVGALQRTIRDWFLHIADVHGRYLSAFECDLVILTGKPSELPDIRTLLEQRLPIAPNRIISAKGYYAGDWLPLSADGRIADAKLVTALGLAVYRGVQAGLIGGWRITGSVHDTYRVQNYWGRIGGNLRPFTESDILLPPDSKQATVRVLTDSFIGRARFLGHGIPEQVYRLRHSGDEQRLVDITLRRTSPAGTGRRYEVSSEALTLTAAKDVQSGKSIPLKDIGLELCTMVRAEEYWQDTGRFEVRWAI